MTDNDITEIVLKCAFTVHTNLGPGLLESAYKACLAYEIKDTGLFVEIEKPMPLFYKEIKLDVGYRIDILVERSIVIEIKTVETFNEAHIAQTLSYMKLGFFKVGLLLNFKTASLKNGIKRLVL